MIRNCDSCARPYEAQRPSSRFCSTKCRVRNGGKRAAAAGTTDQVVVAGSLGDAVRSELAAVGRADTTPGVVAVALAEFIGAPGTSDASRAPMSRELLKIRAELLREVPDPDDPVEQLKRRAQAKRAPTRAEPAGL